MRYRHAVFALFAVSIAVASTRATSEPIHGSTAGSSAADLRWTSIVDGMLKVKARQLSPRFDHGRRLTVVILFHVGADGRIVSNEIGMKSGNPELDRLALRVVEDIAPFPPPPPSLNKGLVWQAEFGDKPNGGSARIPPSLPK